MSIFVVTVNIIIFFNVIRITLLVKEDDFRVLESNLMLRKIGDRFFSLQWMSLCSLAIMEPMRRLVFLAPCRQDFTTVIGNTQGNC
jgi:hypothetical protein